MRAETREDAQILECMDALAGALRAKDIDALMAHYAPDVVVFDLPAALQCRGADAYRRNFETWFAAVQGPIDYEMRDLRVTTSGEVAFCHYLAHVRGTRKTAGKTDYWADYWVRVTAGCRKVNGRWMVTHEHVSVPVNMTTTQAVRDLQP
jgi:ketosteroid isomerase-like protein